MSDQCVHCTLRGNLPGCFTTKCSQHDSWMVQELWKMLPDTQEQGFECAYCHGDQEVAKIAHLMGFRPDVAFVKIRDLERQLKALQEQGLREKYNELLYAVSTKCPGETRHETALRYILQAETNKNNCASQENKP